MMVFSAKKVLLDREIVGLQFSIFKDQSTTQLALAASDMEEMIGRISSLGLRTRRQEVENRRRRRRRRERRNRERRETERRMREASVLAGTGGSGSGNVLHKR